MLLLPPYITQHTHSITPRVLPGDATYEPCCKLSMALVKVV